MPSQNPVIALRLDQATFDKIRELASKDGRSMSNFVEHQLKRLLTPHVDPALPSSYYELPSTKRSGGVQLDITDAIAAAVKSGPITTAQKQASHRKNMAARAARMSERVAKHK